MRKPKFVLTLDSDRYDLIIYSLIEMKNRLTREAGAQSKLLQHRMCGKGEKK